MNLADRYSDSNWSFYASKKNIRMYGLLEPYLRELGIYHIDPVYCTPDQSINISLYLMNQKGYTDYGFSYFDDKGRMEYLISKGVKYAIIGDWKRAKSSEILRLFLDERIGTYGDTEIYTLKQSDLEE